VLMFGMMFGDAGHGALLLVIAALLRLGRPARIARLRRVWPFVAGAGLASIVFGLLYGEFFGPTGVVPVFWLAPLDEPVPLMTAAVAVGAVLLAFAYALAVVNRWREGGPRLALYSASGIGGSTVFLGLGGITAGIYLHMVLLTVLGGAIAAVGLGLVAVRLVVDSGGGVEGVIGVAVGMFDLLMRLGSNLVSFARLAAFGLTHAALSWLFWRGTVGLAGHGVLGLLGAALLFAVGTAVAFTLEALVAGVQALRLEFYELFSRVFETEGHPFRPWHVPLESRAAEEASS
jgi:V/A-type H+-transporting ATPase subunit I